MKILQMNKILPPDQSRVIEQAIFTYSPLEKYFEKLKKTIEEQGKKPFEALKVLKPTEQKLTIKYAIPEDQLNKEAKNKRGKIEKCKK